MATPFNIFGSVTVVNLNDGTNALPVGLPSEYAEQLTSSGFKSDGFDAMWKISDSANATSSSTGTAGFTSSTRSLFISRYTHSGFDRSDYFKSLYSGNRCSFTANPPAISGASNFSAITNVSNDGEIILADPIEVVFALRDTPVETNGVFKFNIRVTKLDTRVPTSAFRFDWERSVDGVPGQVGTDGASVLIVYSNDAAGTNQSLIEGSNEFVQYVEYVTTAPTLPVTGTFVRFIGTDGSNGQSIFPIYATSATGAGQTFTSSASTGFVTFYEATTQPTLPTTGQTFVPHIGEDGTNGNTWLSGSGVPAGSLGNVGDFYLNTSNESVYKKTGATTWTVEVTTLAGSPGNPGTNADIINWVFQDKSGTAPTSPANSAGVPSGWTDAAPSSVTNTLYTVQGIQTAGTGNYDWGTVIKLSGDDGGKGDDGSRGPGRFSASITLATTTIPGATSTAFATNATAAIVTQLGSGATAVQGDVCSITYTTSSGVVSTTSGAYSGSAWAAFALVLDGGLLVNGTVVAASLAADSVTSDKIASNSVTSDSIVSGTIVSSDIQTGTLTGDRFVSNTVTSTQIDTSTLNVQDMSLTGRLDVDNNQGSLAWGKTSGADIATTGLYMGNSGGNPFFNIGDSGSYIQYSNGKLFIVGALFSGSSAENATEEYVNPDISYTYNIPPTASEIKIDFTGGGGGGAGQATGNGTQASPSTTADIHGAQFGSDTDYFGPNQAIAGANGGDTVVKLFSSSDTLLATYTGSGGSGGAATGPNGGQQGFVSVTDSFTAVTNTDPQGEAGNSSAFGAGTGGLSWDFVGSIFNTCGGSADNYSSCSPTRVASVGTGVGSGGGAGGYQVTDPISGISLKGFNLGGKRGSNGSNTVNLASAGAGSGSYLTITVGAGGDGKGSFESTASTTTNGTTGDPIRYLAVSRQGAAGSNGAARITVTVG